MTKNIEPKNNIEQIKDQESHLALLPLKNVVMLPKSIIPIIVGRASSVRAVEYALRHNKSIFVTAQKQADVEQPTDNDIYEWGTRSTILQVMRMPKGTLKILVEGIARARVANTLKSEEDFLTVEIQDEPTVVGGDDVELEAIWRQLRSLYTTYSALNPKAPADLVGSVKSPQEMDIIGDTLAVHINLSFGERQEILETAHLKKRLTRLCSFLQKEIDILETEERIRDTIQKNLEESQRKYYLTEQIKAIQKELGGEDAGAEVAAIRAQLPSLGLSHEAHMKVEKELKRLEQMPPLSAEAVVSRNYVDWLISLPWSRTSKDTISIAQAEKILNKHHAGLKKAKERIIEFLAAKKFSGAQERSPIICLVGPPGVGKTSLARSIADSLGREFVRVSLGGARDEADIRGHRRTYIGALPGKIIQSMRKARTANPVILLDEIDKMSSDFHGDPAAALLEVLDPEQNREFMDHFLEVGYDLSKVMFITTANHIDGIPYALYDRMEKIILAGYTEDEKLKIATSFLIPKNLTEYGLKARQFMITDDVIRMIISQYTKEAGVRQLERIIKKLIRKVIQLLLAKKYQVSVSVSEPRVIEWLGYPKYKKTAREEGENRVGLATGLAWTEVGGDILEIETSVLAGKGNLTLTGQLGDVMQESAHAALSYIRSRAESLGLKASFASDKDIHIHIPEGATPKDGPSAGITMATALVSALTKIPTEAEVAMTGEITLRGRILAVGGLKEKILAARQHGIKTILVPRENELAIKEMINEVNADGQLSLIFVDSMDDVLEKALVKNPFRTKAKLTPKVSRKVSQPRATVARRASRK